MDLGQFVKRKSISKIEV